MTAREDDRQALEDHLDDVRAARRTIPCRAGTPLETGPWISDLLEDQQEAAARCAGCPALETCRTYGLKYPTEEGTYGGLTAPQRRAEARRQRKEAAA